MAAPLILARTFKEAHAFASEKLGLSFGHYRVVNSPGTIKAVRDVTIYLVPGWDKRPDRFTMKAALRFCRLTIVDTAETPVEPKPTTVEITVVSDDTPTPEHHSEMVARVAPHLDPVGDFFDNVDPEPEPLKPACLDCGLEDGNHVDPECPGARIEADLSEMAAVDSNTLETLAEPVEKPKARRRRKCASCEQMHYKGDPCIDSEAS